MSRREATPQERRDGWLFCSDKVSYCIWCKRETNGIVRHTATQELAFACSQHHCDRVKPTIQFHPDDPRSAFRGRRSYWETKGTDEWMHRKKHGLTELS